MAKSAIRTQIFDIGRPFFLFMLFEFERLAVEKRAIDRLRARPHRIVVFARSTRVCRLQAPSPRCRTPRSFQRFSAAASSSPSSSPLPRRSTLPTRCRAIGCSKTIVSLETRAEAVKKATRRCQIRLKITRMRLQIGLSERKYSFSGKQKFTQNTLSKKKISLSFFVCRIVGLCLIMVCVTCLSMSASWSYFATRMRQLQVCRRKLYFY